MRRVLYYISVANNRNVHGDKPPRSNENDVGAD